MNMCKILTSLPWWQNSVKVSAKKGKENSVFLLRDDAMTVIKANGKIWIRTPTSNNRAPLSKEKPNISIFSLFFSLLLLFRTVLWFESFWKMAAPKSHTNFDFHHSGTKYTSNASVFFNSFSFPSSHFVPPKFCSHSSAYLQAIYVHVCASFSCLPTQTHSQHMHVCSLLMNRKRKHTILCANGISGIVIFRFFFVCVQGVKRINTHHWNVDELNFVRWNSKESIWPIVRLSL